MPFLCALSSSPIFWLVCAGMCMAHTCLEGQVIPPAMCLKHVLHGIKMRRKKFLWEGSLEEGLWAGERPLDWGETPWLGAFPHCCLSSCAVLTPVWEVPVVAVFLPSRQRVQVVTTATVMDHVVLETGMKTGLWMQSRSQIRWDGPIPVPGRRSPEKLQLGQRAGG